MKKNMDGATPYHVMFRSGLMKIKFIQKLNVHVCVCVCARARARAHTHTHTHNSTNIFF